MAPPADVDKTTSRWLQANARMKTYPLTLDPTVCDEAAHWSTVRHEKWQEREGREELA